MKINCLRWLFSLPAVCVTASLLQASPFSDAVLSTNPTAYYSMNENPSGVLTQLVDSSPNANHGTWGTTLLQSEVDGDEPPVVLLEHMVPLSGLAGPTPALGFTGIESSNVAAYFSGNTLEDPDGEGPAEANPVPDLMELKTDGTFNNPNATVSFLMSSTETVGNDGRIFTTQHLVSNPLLVVNGGGACPGCIIVSTQDFAPVGLPLASVPTKSDGNWHHVVVVRNGGSAEDAEVYFNGVKFSGSDLVPVFDSFSTTAAAPMIGSRVRGTNPGWGAYEGGLDEFAYWNRALNETEVSAIYDSLFATSGGLDGDFDLNGIVDGRDFLLWQRDPSVGSLADWQNNYGASLPEVATVSVVPEPTSIMLIGIGLLMASCRTRMSV